MELTTLAHDQLAIIAKLEQRSETLRNEAAERITILGTEINEQAETFGLDKQLLVDDLDIRIESLEGEILEAKKHNKRLVIEATENALVVDKLDKAIETLKKEIAASLEVNTRLISTTDKNEFAIKKLQTEIAKAKKVNVNLIAAAKAGELVTEKLLAANARLVLAAKASLTHVDTLNAVVNDQARELATQMNCLMRLRENTELAAAPRESVRGAF